MGLPLLKSQDKLVYQLIVRLPTKSLLYDPLVLGILNQAVIVCAHVYAHW